MVIIVRVGIIARGSSAQLAAVRGRSHPFLLELSIGQATRKKTVDEAADRLCTMKDLSLTRSASALLAAFTDSVFRTAEALSGLATARDFERDISLDEVRFALSTLDPAALLPQLDTDG